MPLPKHFACTTTAVCHNDFFHSMCNMSDYEVITGVALTTALCDIVLQNLLIGPKQNIYNNVCKFLLGTIIYWFFLFSTTQCQGDLTLSGQWHDMRAHSGPLPQLTDTLMFSKCVHLELHVFVLSTQRRPTLAWGEHSYCTTPHWNAAMT